MREGGYVPSFIEHRKRSEQALISVIQEAVVQGVSTRKIETVLAEFGIAGVSAGQVRQLRTALDEKVRQFRERPLGESRYVWVDALYEKVREDDRVESMAVVIATGVNAQGQFSENDAFPPLPSATPGLPMTRGAAETNAGPDQQARNWGSSKLPMKMSATKNLH